MKFCVFFSILLIVRLLFYTSPYRKNIAFYIIKAAVESTAFVALFYLPFEIELLCVGLLIALNLLSFLLEAKLSMSTKASPILTLHFYTGLALYIICFGFVFSSGKVLAFEDYVIELALRVPALLDIKFYVLVMGSIFILAEEEHIIQFFRQRIEKQYAASIHERKAIFRQRLVGYTERLLIYVLVLLSQYAAAGIIAGSKFIATLGAPKRHRESEIAASVASICLAVMSAVVINTVVGRV